MTKDIFTGFTMGGRVKWLREKKNMKPADLARAATIRQPSLWAIENDVTKPEKIRASTLMRLADVLDSTVEFIRDGRGDPHSATPGDAKELLDLYASMESWQRAALMAAARALNSGD